MVTMMLRIVNVLAKRGGVVRGVISVSDNVLMVPSMLPLVLVLVKHTGLVSIVLIALFVVRMVVCWMRRYVTATVTGCTRAPSVKVEHVTCKVPVILACL